MTVIDLNEIYKIIYYKYILPFKVLDKIGVKHSHLRPWAKNREFTYSNYSVLVTLIVTRL